jgi:hypothetical protein
VDFQNPNTLAPGHALARGVWRFLAGQGATAVPEFSPARGLRCDLTALSAEGELWIIECKSSRSDFVSDTKWEKYLSYCDRFFWAVDEAFPVEILPSTAGLIVADAHDAAIVRAAPVLQLSPARRKAQTLKLARTAARRLHGFMDPQALGL